MASALSEVGISDANHLRVLLNETNDALGTIAEFERVNRINLDSLAPALPLLDLHSVCRYEFHNSVFDQLKLVLERRIEDLARKPKEESYQAIMKILDKAFPLASSPLLQPVVMRLLTKLDNIPQEKLDALVMDEALYHSAPLEVRRHIWLSNPDLFCNEVREEIRKFIKDVESDVQNFKSSTWWWRLDPRTRREKCPFLKRIVEMTRANATLYKNAIDSIKDEFKIVPLHSQPFVASLRSGLLMALHDSEHQEMVAADTIYKFAWCMDACIRSKSIDEKQQRELTQFLNSLRRNSSLFDASLILFDPSAISLIICELEKEVRALLSDMRLPKQSDRVYFLLRLLSLGVMAPELGKDEKIHEREVDAGLVTRLITSMIFQLAKREEEDIDMEMEKLSGDKSNGTAESPPVEPPACWTEFLAGYGRLAGQILRIQTKMTQNFVQILPLMGRHCRDMLSDQVFLNEIARYVLKSRDRSDEFFQPIMLKFFVSGKQAREIAADGALKLMDALGPTISDAMKEKVNEKLLASKNKEDSKKKDKKKKDGKKKDKKDKEPEDTSSADPIIPREKGGKIDKKKSKKTKSKTEPSENLKITLKNLT